MPVPANITGQKFHRLTAIRPTGGRIDGGVEWECRCDCPAGKTVYSTVNRLRRGNTKSCGCLQREHASRAGRLVSSHSLPKKCLHCGKSFGGTSKQKFCSRECKEASELVTREPRRCQNPRCDRTIAAARSDQLYCSVRCKTQSRNPPLEPGKCPICGEPVPRIGRSIYCLGACRRVAASRLKFASRFGTPFEQVAAIRARIDTSGIKIEEIP